MAGTTNGRGSWGSSLGFILAAAGSAIGLGNIWGFPYKAAQSGGAAFVVLYLLCVALIGIPVLFAELAIGRSTQKSPVGAFQKLAPRSGWPLVGGLGVITGFAILSFYSVIAGYTLGYLFKAVRGEFASGITVEQSEALFEGLKGSPALAVFWTAVFFFLTMIVVRGGIHGGIERASKILMPVFFLLLVGIAVRSMTLPDAGEGIRFLFNADFSKLTPKVVLDALSQALFSMSLGMGAMITYGSYLGRQENLPMAGVTVALADTVIALLAGLMIFPALFSTGASPEEGGMGLVFKILPSIFQKIPLGNMFGIAFYILLTIAALTSAISLMEVIVSYFVDEHGWGREKTTWMLGTSCFLLAALCAVSGTFMETIMLLFYDYALAVGALLICLFVGWRWGPESAVGELKAEGHTFPGLTLWGFLIKFFCPVVAGIIIVTRFAGH